MSVDRAQESGWPLECREERCTFYSAYMRWGPPAMPHAAFHAAERDCQDAQLICEDWLHQHRGEELPPGMSRWVQNLEKEVRA